MKVWKAWSLRAEAQRLVIFTLFKNKKRIFRQLVLNFCKLLWRAIEACVLGYLSIFVHSRKRSNAFEDARILILPKFNHICSNLLFLPKFCLKFSNFTLILHKSNQTCPKPVFSKTKKCQRMWLNHSRRKTKQFGSGRICPNIRNKIFPNVYCVLPKKIFTKIFPLKAGCIAFQGRL